MFRYDDYNIMYVRLNTMTNRDINKVRKRVLISSNMAAGETEVVRL